MLQFKQKGQAVVEFAMIAPIFFLLVFGFIYLAMFFMDYTTLNNIARNETRKAIVNSIPDSTYVISTQNSNTKLMLLSSYYQFGSSEGIKCNLKTEAGTKTVTINAARKSGDLGFLNVVLPENYSVSYSMYGE